MKENKYKENESCLGGTEEKWEMKAGESEHRLDDV